MDAALLTKENGFEVGNLIEYTTNDGNTRYGILKSVEEFNGQPVILVDRRGTLISEIVNIKVHTFPWCLWLYPQAKNIRLTGVRPFWACND